MSQPPQLQPFPNPGLLRQATDHLAGLVFYKKKPERRYLADPDYVRAFQHVVRVHGVGPLLGLRIEHGELQLTEQIDRWLIERLGQNRRRLERMHTELGDILDAFAHTGVFGIPLKGTAMLLDGADRLAWRPLADHDFLLRHDDRLKIDLTYAHAGYCLRGTTWKHRIYEPCEAGEREVYIDGDHPDNPRDIDSHTAVTEMFRGFRWDLTPWIVNNLTEHEGVSVPTDQAMALHLAVHTSIAALESTGRMIHIVDLGHVLATSGVTSIRTAVMKSAAGYHARFVYPALALVTRWTGDPAAAALTAGLAPYLPPRMEEWISTASFYDISWDSLNQRPMLDRIDLWARSRPERLRMLAATLALSPNQLASAGYTGSGPRALATWYVRHYRHLARRLRTRLG